MVPVNFRTPCLVCHHPNMTTICTTNILYTIQSACNVKYPSTTQLPFVILAPLFLPPFVSMEEFAMPTFRTCRFLNGQCYGWSDCQQKNWASHSSSSLRLFFCPYPFSEHIYSASSSQPCLCPVGYTGVYCQDEIPPCTLTCQNGGECQVGPPESILSAYYYSDWLDTTTEDQTNGPPFYYCACPPGWGGQLCEAPAVECGETLCVSTVEHAWTMGAIASRPWTVKRVFTLTAASVNFPRRPFATKMTWKFTFVPTMVHAEKTICSGARAQKATVGFRVSWTTELTATWTAE